MSIQYILRSSFQNWGEELGAVRKSELTESAAKRRPDAHTFLSHSSKDADLLPGVIRILKNHGAAVYIDKKDSSLPPYTCRQTAADLRERIRVSKNFILLATEASKDSRWVPWELGLADGFKTQARVAILPAVENRQEKDWAEREYYGVYDRIVWGDHNNYNDRVWMVWNQEKNTATELSRWLSK